ncbi:30S ribosomal protein S4 [candidate division WOR-3 bacterium RBG_13_43_14]|uniref:Small ribosomal subunit protein uS4 n=1 Tax=candidate division WOR-3 bacterium RBG_13_43_14 TaxID=1802590 RepID=A0A1F4UC24_UNCW3|nr:MAG: 30S ribosomal protein S4 [candidate division WOR-3 bacterium RBG_13_43_14]
MARYIGAKCRICRREGEKLFLRGSRCFTDKCSFIRRGYPPGTHGKVGRRKLTSYAIQLREKQKVKAIYGILEQQFRKIFHDAVKKPGNPGENLLVALETRLDNVLYQLGLASSRTQARQFIRHGHILVDGKNTDIPSYHIRVNQVIQIAEQQRKNVLIKKALEERDPEKMATWLKLDREKMLGQITRMPKREDITSPIQESLIVEFYSK